MNTVEMPWSSGLTFLQLVTNVKSRQIEIPEFCETVNSALELKTKFELAEQGTQKKYTCLESPFGNSIESTSTPKMLCRERVKQVLVYSLNLKLN